MLQSPKTNPALRTCTYHNSFLIPTADEAPVNIGEINFALFPYNKIQLILFPAKRLFEMYISRTVLTDMEIISEFC